MSNGLSRCTDCEQLDWEIRKKDDAGDSACPVEWTLLGLEYSTHNDSACSPKLCGMAHDAGDFRRRGEMNSRHDRLSGIDDDQTGPFALDGTRDMRTYQLLRPRWSVGWSNAPPTWYR